MSTIYAYASTWSLPVLGESIKDLRSYADAIYSDWCSSASGLEDRAEAIELIEVVETGDVVYVLPEQYKGTKRARGIEVIDQLHNKGAVIIELGNEEHTA